MLAPGHGPLSFPPALAKARKDPAIAERIVQAYEPKQYSPDGRYIVLGAGIASVNEWANILDIGGSVLALTRQAQPETQDLNVPRCLFESQRDRRLRLAPLRPADPVPRRRAAGDAAGPQDVAADDRGRAQGGSLRRARRRDHPGRTRPGRAADVRREPRRHRGSGLAGRDRGDGRDRLQQVRAHDPAAAAADPALRRAGAGRADEAADQLRRARPGPPGLAAVLHGPDRQQRDPARRHDRGPEVHRPAVRLRLRAGRASPAPLVRRAGWRCRRRWGGT